MPPAPFIPFSAYTPLCSFLLPLPSARPLIGLYSSLDSSTPPSQVPGIPLVHNLNQSQIPNWDFPGLGGVPVVSEESI